MPVLPGTWAAFLHFRVILGFLAVLGIRAWWFSWELAGTPACLGFFFLHNFCTIEQQRPGFMRCLPSGQSVW